MNKKYLKDNGLYEAHKQFMRLCEWSYASRPLEEDGEEGQQDPNMGGDPNAMGGAPDPNMGGQDPNAMGDDANAMGGDEMPPMGEDPMMDDPNMGEEDDVIDVEDLTNAQEIVNDKVSHLGKDLGNVDTTITKLMQTVDKLESMIDKNNEKIDKLNSEFQSRVKTPTERLNLRSLDSYPFNVKPTEFWDKVSQNPNYDISMNNAEPTADKTYEIKQDDVNAMNDREVEDSFIDPDLNQTIEKIFGL